MYIMFGFCGCKRGMVIRGNKYTRGGTGEWWYQPRPSILCPSPQSTPPLNPTPPQQPRLNHDRSTELHRLVAGFYMLRYYYNLPSKITHFSSSPSYIDLSSSLIFIILLPFFIYHTHFLL